MSHSLDYYSITREMAGGVMRNNPEKPLEELLKIPNVDPIYLFIEAASYNLIDKMEEISRRYNVDINAYSPDRNGMRGTALSSASMGNSIMAIQWLLERGADPNSKLYDDSSGAETTSLWLCAESGNVRSMKLLIDAGADVNAIKKPTNNSVLYIAVQNCHKSAITLLLSHGANPNLFNFQARSFPPIAAAVMCCMNDVVAQLINAGSMVDLFMPLIERSFRALESTGTTSQVLGRIRTVSKAEIKTLKKLVDVNTVKRLRENATYLKAMKAERKGNYRKALRLLQQVPDSLAKTQLGFDLQRNYEYIYGIKGSDARVSVWHQVPRDENADEPASIQFGAWCQVGRKIYKHGGRDFGEFKDLSKRAPHLDELWELDIDTKEWRKLKTTGQSPGPRSGHNMFTIKNVLYMWGGADSLYTMADTNLYCLDLGPDGKGTNNTYVWKVVKTKGSLKPSPREAFGAVYYKGKYYISGGELEKNELCDEFWCLNMSNLRWTYLKPDIKRHHHRMFAGRGKIFALGGRIFKEGVENVHMASCSTSSFNSYDIEQGVWSTVPVIGDKPHDISEYCAIPVYDEDTSDRDEAMGIIVFGGYTEPDKQVLFSAQNHEMALKKMYGDDYQDFSMSYIKRLLRYDFDTNAWTKLEATTGLLPKADTYAAHVETKSGKEIKILIGGGYGFTQKSMQQNFFDREIHEDLMEGYRQSTENLPIDDQTSSPEASMTMYEVTISDTSNLCSIRDDFDGSNWAWKFYEKDNRMTVVSEFISLSPTLYYSIDLVETDFVDPPCNSVEPDNQEELLGVRVQLRGLVGRKDLNGAIGRCGTWQKEKGRYQVFLPSYEKGGPFTFSVKPTNLRIAKPLEQDFVKDIKMNGLNGKFPSVMLAYTTPLGKKLKSNLDYVLDNVSCNEKCSMANDIYHGPVSAEAQVILRTVCMSPSPNGPLTQLLGNFDPKEAKSEDAFEKSQILINFFKMTKERDTKKVKEFELNLLASTVGIDDGNVEWLKLSVSLDGISSITREIIVRADVSLNSLHNQILCPCIGWSENFHCYAFRRTYFSGNLEEISKKTNDEIKEIMRKRLAECWIGPKRSVAIDVIYQPLYIGGAVADDKVITLKHLFPTDSDTMSLQYVCDFGDWWSHTINVSKYDKSPPDGVSVAHLISGSGACPPEDLGGAMNYMQVVTQLKGKLPRGKEKEYLSPSNQEWWKTMNSEIRSKRNIHGVSQPFDFDLEKSRLKLSIALRSKRAKSSEISLKFNSHDMRTGLPLEAPSKKKVLKDPTTFCAVCKVTVGLKLCSSCRSIAFCCREHQKAFWPRHKAECKKISKSTKSGKSRK